MTDKYTLNDCIIRSQAIGSGYICNPPPTDTDDDSIILVNGYYDWESKYKENGWVASDEEEYALNGQFKSFRLGTLNAIVTEDENFYRAFVVATEAARSLNLLKKEDRIKLFDSVINTFNQEYNPEDYIYNYYAVNEPAEGHLPVAF